MKNNDFIVSSIDLAKFMLDIQKSIYINILKQPREKFEQLGVPGSWDSLSQVDKRFFVQLVAAFVKDKGPPFEDMKVAELLWSTCAKFCIRGVLSILEHHTEVIAKRETKFNDETNIDDLEQEIKERGMHVNAE